MPTDQSAAYESLCNHTRETAKLASIMGLLEWDERTKMPPAGGEYRAEQMTFLTGLAHRQRTSKRLGELLGELSASELMKEPHSEAATTIRELERFSSVDEALRWARGRRVVARMPLLSVQDGTRLLVIPGDPLHPESAAGEVPLETRFEFVDRQWRAVRSRTQG